MLMMGQKDGKLRMMVIKLGSLVPENHYAKANRKTCGFQFHLQVGQSLLFRKAVHRPCLLFQDAVGGVSLWHGRVEK